MTPRVEKRYRLGDFWLEPEKRVLRRGDARVHLSHQPFQLLLYLIEHRDRLVPRAELLERFWDGHDVYDETLTKCVGAIRKALADHLEHPRFIETRWAEGYRYVGPLEEHDGEPILGTVEIEKTRGLKIVIEEEDTDPAAVLDAYIRRTQPAAVARHRVALTRPSFQGAVLVLIAIAALTAAAVVLSRGRIAVAPSGPSPINSIAVLPLKNLTGDAANDYLSDGITESLISGLSRVSGLKVISSGSVFRFKGEEVEAREVGRRLHVASVLEGTVWKSGESVRVEVRLASTEDGRVLWASEAFERPLGEIFSLLDEIARGAATELRLNLGDATAGEFVRRYTRDVEAYEAYLRGRYFWNKRTVRTLENAIGHFSHAIARDPKYALAYAGLADSYALLEFLRAGSVPPREAMLKGKQAALTALGLDDTLAEAHTSLAANRQGDWDWGVAEREYRRAIELNPNYATARHWYALFLAAMGRFPEAIDEGTLAVTLDPLSLIIHADLGQIFYLARQYDRAISQSRKALEMEPRFGLASIWLARAYQQTGRPEEAIAEIEQMHASDVTSATTLALGQAYAAAGRTARARRVLADVLAQSKGQYVSAYDVAAIYATLGQSDRAFEWLERAYRESSGWLAFLNVEPMFDGLRGDPRLASLVERIGLAPAPHVTSPTPAKLPARQQQPQPRP